MPGRKSRATDQFLAGLPNDQAALAEAIGSHNPDQDDDITRGRLLALFDTKSAVRLRVARRLLRAKDITPPVAQRLQVLAADDSDHRVRSAAQEALDAHLGKA